MEEEEVPPEPEKVEAEKADPIPDNIASEDDPALSKPAPEEPDGA